MMLVFFGIALKVCHFSLLFFIVFICSFFSFHFLYSLPNFLTDLFFSFFLVLCESSLFLFSVLYFVLDFFFNLFLPGNYSFFSFDFLLFHFRSLEEFLEQFYFDTFNYQEQITLFIQICFQNNMKLLVLWFKT